VRQPALLKLTKDHLVGNCNVLHSVGEADMAHDPRYESE
jgi:hypothetical protein